MILLYRIESPRDPNYQTLLEQMGKNIGFIPFSGYIMAPTTTVRSVKIYGKISWGVMDTDFFPVKFVRKSGKMFVDLEKDGFTIRHEAKWADGND